LGVRNTAIEQEVRNACLDAERSLLNSTEHVLRISLNVTWMFKILRPFDCKPNQCRKVEELFGQQQHRFAMKRCVLLTA
jgi:hypothetical protein